MFQQDLPIEQWRVLLLLHKRAMFTAGRNAINVMHTANATTTDLVALARKSMLLAKQNGQEIDVRRHIRTEESFEDVDLAATAEGLHWPRANKVNLALFAVVEHKKGSATPLIKVTAVAGLDAVVKLANHGLAEVLDSVAETVDPARLGTTKMAALKTYLMRLTRRGEDLVNLT